MCCNLHRSLKYKLIYMILSHEFYQRRKYITIFNNGVALLIIKWSKQSPLVDKPSKDYFLNL